MSEKIIFSRFRMKTPLKEMMQYPRCDKTRDELISIFNSLKTSSNNDRFHYIRTWNGTLEEEPINLTAGLVAAEQPVALADDTPNAEVLLPASSELNETVND